MRNSSKWSLPLQLAVVLFFGLVSDAMCEDKLPPKLQWKFGSAFVNGSRLKAVQGGLDGDVQGRVHLQDSPPAMHFDGAKNHIAWQTSDLPTKTLPKRECTFEAWVAVDRVQEWGAIIGAVQDNGSYERGWLLGYRKSRFCLAIASEKTKRLTYLTANEDFVPGAWYHVVGTYDGEVMKLFVDGELAASSQTQSGDIAYPPNTWLELGAYHDDNELYLMSGKLAEAAIYDAVLSSEAIKQQFEANKGLYPDVDATVEDVVAWPTYMHDNTRSGVTQETVKLPLHKSWEYHAKRAPAPAWPPPAKQDFWHNKHGLPARVTFDRAMHVVSDGRRVYFGSSSEDQVFAISLETGERVWSYFTEGPVRLAPTVAEGKVYFGSDDGCVYCVNAENGSLVWQFDVKESSKRIPGNGRLISLTPVRTGVLIDSGKARFAAGLFPLQGTYQYALDMQTGKELAKGQITFSPQGYMQRRGGAVMVAQGRAPTTTLTSVDQVKKSKTEDAGSPIDEYPLSQIRAGDMRFAGGKGSVAAFDRDNNKLWSAEVAGAAYSLAVVDHSLLVSTDRGIVYRFSSGELKEPTTWKHENPTDAELDAVIAKEAGAILASRESDQGYALLIGDSAGPLAIELCRRSQLKIVCVVPNDEDAIAARKLIDGSGVYGQAVVNTVKDDELPYASGLFNVVVHRPNTNMEMLKAEEVYRLLRPGDGMAIVLHEAEADADDILTRWSKMLPKADVKRWNNSDSSLIVTRPPLENAGSWTHIYAGVGNTSCSDDERVAGDLKLQWFGEPGPQEMLDRHHRTVPPLYIDGRMFMPGNERVYCVDAYNGTVLWNVEVANSRRVAAMRDAGSMAASKEYLYIAAGDRCYGLASESGAFALNMPVPMLKDGQARGWGYVAYVDDQLFGSATKPEASRDDHSREQIKATYYDFVPLVTSDALFSMNRHTGKLLWKYEATGGAIVNSTITIGDGSIYFVESANAATLAERTGKSKLETLFNQPAKVVALDLTTGDVGWKTDFDLSDLQHQIFMAHAQGKLAIVGTKNKRDGLKQFVWYDLHGFDASTGKHVWSATQNQRWGINGDHGEQDHHPTIVGNTLYQQPYAYDLHTGTRRSNWQFARGGHGCGALSASSSSVFFRAANPTMCDLNTGKNQKVTAVSRPGCWINMIPAGGLLMIPEASSGCTCNFPIQASMVFAPAGDF